MKNEKGSWIILIVGLILGIGLSAYLYVSLQTTKQVDAPPITKDDYIVYANLINDSSSIYVEGYFLKRGAEVELFEPEVYVTNLEDGICYKLPTECVINTDITEQYAEDGYKYDNSGFRAIAIKKKIPSGRYSVEIYNRVDGAAQLLSDEMEVE